MPQFVIHARDKPDAAPRRADHIASHRAFLDTAKARFSVEVLLSGPLVGDAGSEMIGSFLLVEAPARAAIEVMIEQDPLRLAGVWRDVDVARVHIRQDNWPRQP